MGMANRTEARDLTFSDWPMFDRVMQDKEVCRGFLEVVLGMEIEDIEYVDAERTLIPDPYSKCVRMDVVARSPKRVFDIEMQAVPEPALGRRFRYYQAAMDVSLTEPGADYRALPESYVVFLCKSDPFGAGIPVYTMANRCNEDVSVCIDDGRTLVALNASAWDRCEDGRLSALLQYVEEGDVGDDGLTERIDAMVKTANADRRWKDDAMGFMTLEMHMNARLHEAEEKALEKGLEEGLEKGLEKGISKGESRANALTAKLLEDNRLDDLKRQINDESLRNHLYEEYGI